MGVAVTVAQTMAAAAEAMPSTAEQVAEERVVAALGREVEAALEVLGQGTVLVTSSPPRSRVPPLVPWPLGGSAIRTMSAFLQAAFSRR